MKVIKLMTIGLLISGVTLLTNCSKEEGPAGPTGPAGKDGNANVRSSTIFISGSEWTTSTGEAFVTKQVAEITSEIVDNGVVMVYMKTDNAWEALPSTYTSFLGEVFTFGYSIEPGKLNLKITSNMILTFTAANIGDNDFRIAVISAAARVQNPEMDIYDYSQVESFIAN